MLFQNLYEPWDRDRYIFRDLHTSELQAIMFFSRLPLRWALILYNWNKYYLAVSGIHSSHFQQTNTTVIDVYSAEKYIHTYIYL